MKKSYGKNVIGRLFIIGMLLPLWACSPAMDAAVDHEPETTEDSMNLAHQISTDLATIPPIDAAAPTLFETASFGLG